MVEWIRRMGFVGAALLGLFAAAAARAADSGELLYFPDDEALRRIDLDTVDHPPIVEDVLIASTGDDRHALAGPRGGGNVNGKICMIPDGTQRFVMSEDAGQPRYPAGYAVFEPGGQMIGKLVPTFIDNFADPTGCATDSDGHLFTLEAGDEGFGSSNGELFMWFPPYDQFPGPEAYPNTETSTNYCKLDVTIGTATNVALDEVGQLLVTSPSSGSVYRYSGPLPTAPNAAGGCGRFDSTGAPLVDAGRLTREVFIHDGTHAATPSGLARGPNGHWFVGDVLFGRIAEFDSDGHFVRLVVDSGEATTHPTLYGSPQSIAFDSKGNLYYADLDLVGDNFFDPDTGPDGKVWRVRFDDQGVPQTPEVLRSGMRFPDGVSVLPGNLEPTQSRTLGGSEKRLYFNSQESTITAQNVSQLVTRWTFVTAAIVTGSPSAAFVNLPGEGRVQLVFFQDWGGTDAQTGTTASGNVYAVRLSDGSQLWRFRADDQPGASYPGAGSATIAEIDGTDTLLIGSGETLYALDAATGTELWRFVAGTGCRDALGQPPGLCSFDGERNEIESTPIVVGNLVYFGMDVNDDPTGKGGFYAVDVHTGYLSWFFDLETGATCRPDPGDAITHYDGYHSEAELALPAGFLNAHPSCNADRTTTGCSNVWSSATVDPVRGYLYTVSANCDTDNDPATPAPPTSSPWQDAIFALDLQGNPVWHWRPSFDVRDPDFGAVPNLFAIQFGGASRDVIGVGGKDGSYYVIDRDGVNHSTGVRWDDADPSALPYWSTRVVQGGAIGGIIASASADEGARRIYFSTAPGDTQADVFNPQRPTMHALDMDSGAIVWDNGTTGSGLNADASYGPTSAIPGVVFTGAVISPTLRAWDAQNGALLFAQLINPPNQPGLSNAVASAATVVDGTVLVGTGIGTRTGDPHDIGDQISREPRAVVALCVPGTKGCGACQNGIDDDHDGYTDFPDDPGCDSPDDPSEKTPRLACDDGIDNDGDGKIDMLDPGCPFPHATYEDPPCDDGIDNNGDGKIDFDDPNCTREWPYWEKTTCGLGAELVLVMPLLAWARRRR